MARVVEVGVVSFLLGNFDVENVVNYDGDVTCPQSVCQLLVSESKVAEVS